MDSQLLSEEPTEIVLKPQPYKKKYMLFMILAGVFAVAAVALLIVTLTKEGKCDDTDLQKENDGLKSQVQALSIQNAAMQATIGTLAQQIADMKQQNETLYYNKQLLLDQLQLQFIQLQVKPAADIHYVHPQVQDRTPIIKKINLNKNSLTAFTGNVIPDIESLNLGFNDIGKFQNNQLPMLNELNLQVPVNQTLQIKSFSNNYIGRLGELPVLRDGPLMSFNQNILPLVKSLDLSNSSLSTFNNNSLPALVRLDLSSTFISIFESYTLNNLQTADLSGCGLVRFDNNELPLLSSLSINSNLLKTFGKSNMPELWYLSITRNSFSNFAELLKYPKLDTLIADANAFTAVEKQNNEVMTYLSLMENAALKSFKDNVFTKLTGLSINGCSLLTVDAFTNNTLPEVTVLQAARSGFTKFTEDFGDQIPKLNVLLLGGSPIAEFNYPAVEIRLKFLDLMDTPLTEFSNRAMPTLEHLYIGGSQMTTFSKNDMRNLWRFNAKGAQLTTIQCDQLPMLKEVQLANNQLTDDIADVLVACNLQSLETLDISGNKLTDTKAAEAKLVAAYPQAKITV